MPTVRIIPHPSVSFSMYMVSVRPPDCKPFLPARGKNLPDRGACAGGGNVLNYGKLWLPWEVRSVQLSQFIAGLSPVSAIILAVALMLFSGFLMTRLTKLLRLPNVTAYIVAGILIGPYVPESRARSAIIDGTDFSVRYRAGVHRLLHRRVFQALRAEEERPEGRVDHSFGGRAGLGVRVRSDVFRSADSIWRFPSSSRRSPRLRLRPPP